jgi:hypothetical protein
MSQVPSFTDIQKEFRVSFGYIQNDMKAICRGKETINYTLALLVAVACEMLAAARGDRKQPENALTEILSSQWRPLAKRLFDAFRNGLAHGFDTKHIVVNGASHQIYMQWQGTLPVEIVHSSGGIQLCIRPRVLADLICAKIDELEDLLRSDATARKRWFNEVHLHKREIKLDAKGKAAWKALI